MGILTYIKLGIGGLVLMVIIGAGWYVHHLRAENISLKAEVETLKLSAEIIEKSQKATEKYQTKKKPIQRKAVAKDAEIDQTVQAGDGPHLRDMFIERGLLQPAQSNTSPSGTPGNPRNLPGR